MNALELIDYLVAGATLLIGVGVGRRARPRPPAPLRPVCSCGDGLGVHDNGGRCHADKLTVIDSFNNKKLKQCPCRRYDGPDPSIFGLNPLP